MALTKKQQQILDAIVFLIRRGGPPTVREVGDLVGLRSPATVSKHLKALKEAGLITINGKSHFGIGSPFGGTKQSGLGYRNGEEGYKEYLDAKTIGMPE